MRFAEKCFIFVLLSFLVLTNFEFSNPGMANRVEVIRTRGTIVVNASGGGDFMKIQPAIDAAQVGDTVYVEKGNYNENIEINKSIDLVGEGSEEVLIFKDSWWPVVDITSDDVNISGFSIADGDRGISLSGASNCIITNINFTGNSIGLEIDDWRGNSYDNQITNNIFYDNGDGIYINNNDGNEIIDNNLTHNWNGIHILSSKNTRIASNTCTFNGADGINVWSSNNTEISFNNCSNNGIHGIFLVESDTIEISSNNCLQNIVGIKLNNSYDVLIDRNECNNNYRDGICVSLTDNYTYNSNDNILKDNICNSNSQNGISLQQSENNYIINNTCLENGISLVESDGCYLINNTCTEKWFGIMMDRSRNNYLERNVLVKNGLNIRGDSLSHWNTHSIDTSNVVNGKPLRFLKNTTGETVPVGSGQIILAYCTNMVIENQEFTNVAVGITIAFSSHCVISNNTCNSIGSGFDYVGIQLSHSHDNIVSGNQCNSNQGTIMGSGIELYCSDRNEVIENTCDLNHHYGISIRYSFDNVVSNNTCSRNGADGIFLYSSNNNIIDNNTIISNGEYGITTA